MESTYQIEEIPIEDLGQTWGPRPTERMVEHVKRHGVLVPILVTRTPDEDGVLALRVIDGNRRINAASDAGLATVPAIIL
ncbi:MAG TPA: ParB N-terminal domain-containing protein, partial [Thermomicrobiales bacterium]|nr:ParB N-terminal domain-containing protein [Thermomicrobiales bacterium]